MRSTLFISDLHLHATRPATTAAFFRFMNDDTTSASALYILGDLFEYWVGDDQLDHDPLARDVANALKKRANEGVSIFFMRGNRDFLIGNRFAEAAGLTLLDDPTVIDVDGKPWLLLHGDTLCTDDVDYQKFRLQARDPAWQAEFLAKTYDTRVDIAKNIRARSTTEKAAKPEDIMDVSTTAVEACFRQHGYIDMIHGHTHRPARHVHVVDGKECVRQVLADWHDEAKLFSLTGDTA